MFLERLNQVGNAIEGTIALSLVDRDGIPVESVSSAPELDLEVLSAELVAQVRAMGDSQRDLAVGQVQQFAVTTDSMIFMVSSVSSDYYLLLVLAADGNYGRARFELRRARLLLEEDLQ